MSTSRPLFDAPLNLSEPARLRLQELAVTDARFDPSVVEAGVRDAVAAWAAAMDGDDEAFGLVASPRAFDEILHPRGSGTRVFIRDLHVERIWIEEPITICGGISNRNLDDLGPQRVVVPCSGRRCVEDLATGELLSDSREDQLCFSQAFDLYPDGTPSSSWRVVSFRFTLLAPVGEFLSCRETTEETRQPRRDGSRSAQWVLPSQLPEACEVGIGGDERDAVFDGQGAERGVWDEVAAELVGGDQLSEDEAVLGSRLWHPCDRCGDPVGHALPCGGRIKWPFEGARVG